MAFTTGLEDRAAEMLALAGEDVRLVLVEASATEADQLALLNRISNGDPSDDSVISLGLGVQFGRISIVLDVYDESIAREFAGRYGVDAICVDGLAPELVIPHGPQPTEGDGWRLLVDAPGVGRPWATGFADDQTALEVLWDRIGLTEPLPMIDFAQEVVIWFGPAVSGSCSAIRLDDLVFDMAGALVYPVIVLPGGNQNCTSDANPHAYLLAVNRTRLPERPFTVELVENACVTMPGVCEEQRTLVTGP